jgi:predicted dehydrogenase
MDAVGAQEVFRSADEAVAYVQKVPKAQGETMLGVPFPQLDVVRVGFIGVGGRGSSLLREMLAVEGAKIVAISDPIEEHLQKNKESIEKAGQPTPALEADWRKLCERKDIDLVYVCSAWKDHVPQAVYAMECGKMAAVEVPAATTLADCWRLVDTSERTRKHCMMLENCCYGPNEMLALNMVRAGLFGTITHGEAAYIHDLRSTLLATRSEGLWRRVPHIERNGNLYPTHGLGPVAWYMDIHRSDRFTKLVSMSSQSAALEEYREKTVDASDPRRKETYKCGDMNSSLIQTAQGRTILLQHDVVTPRPYSRLNLVAGTKGAFCDFPPRVFFDGDGHDWKPIESVQEKWQHKLWKNFGETALKLGGHGGMDYIMNYRIIDLIHKGLAPDIDAYAAAAWSAPGPLSDISVAWGNIPLPFPDFTRGKWNNNKAPLPCHLE